MTRPLLHLALAGHVERHNLGWFWVAPLDVVFGPLTLVEPDLLFVARGRRDLLTEREITGAPDLAIEILSPSTARTDRGRKRALYQEQGVREYWIVDADEERVEVWRPGAMAAEVCEEAVAWQPDPGTPALRIDLAGIFKPI